MSGKVWTPGQVDPEAQRAERKAATDREIMALLDQPSRPAPALQPNRATRRRRG